MSNGSPITLLGFSKSKQHTGHEFPKHKCHVKGKKNHGKLNVSFRLIHVQKSFEHPRPGGHRHSPAQDDHEGHEVVAHHLPRVVHSILFL